MKFKGSLYFLLFASTASSYASQKPSLPEPLAPLWEMAREEQSRSEDLLSHGLWPNSIVHRNSNRKVAEDHNIFSSLQTMTMLLDLSRKYDLPGFENMEKNFSSALHRFYEDTRISQRRHGSIAFWRYREMEDGEWLHTFSPKYDDIAFTHYVDLPNDMDDSAYAIMYLSQKSMGNEKILSFADLVRNYKEESSGAYWTWVKENPTAMNTTDCVVNINILNAAQHISHYNNRLLLGVDTSETVRYLRQFLRSGDLTTCSYYYSRPSQFLFALARLLKNGGGAFSVKDFLRARHLTEAQLAKSSESFSILELAELIASFKIYSQSSIFPLPPLKEEEAELLMHRESLLRQKLRDIEKASWRELGSVFLGDFGEAYHWHTRSQTAITAIYALTEPFQRD